MWFPAATLHMDEDILIFWTAVGSVQNDRIRMANPLPCSGSSVLPDSVDKEPQIPFISYPPILLIPNHLKKKPLITHSSSCGPAQTNEISKDGISVIHSVVLTPNSHNSFWICSRALSIFWCYPQIRHCHNRFLSESERNITIPMFSWSFSKLCGLNYMTYYILPLEMGRTQYLFLL